MKYFLSIALIFWFLFHSAYAQESGNLVFDNSYIHEIRIEFGTSDFHNILLDNFDSTPQEVGNRVPYLIARVTIDGETLDSIGVRYKGFTSFASSNLKKPIKLDFNEFVPNRRLDGLRKLNLNNGTGDPAMQRDVICYDMLRAAGVSAPRTSYANVYINNTYWGIYQLIEQVDKEFIKDNFSNDDGNLFKNKGWSKFEWLGSNPNPYKEIFELKTNREKNDWSGFVHFVDFLNNSSDTDFEQNIEQIFNVDLYLKTLAIDVSTNNWDSYLEHGRNWYLYEDTNTGVFHWIPWDYNFALDSYGFGLSNDEIFVFTDFVGWTNGSKEVKFINTSFYNGGEANYHYDFGDGNISTEKSPTHLYSQAGNYNVCLTVSIANEVSEIKCKIVNTYYDFAQCPSILSGQFSSEVNEAFVQTVDINPSCCGIWSEDCDEIYGWFTGNGMGSPDFTINQEENDGVLIRRLMSISKYKEKYYRYFCEINNQVFSPDYYAQFIDIHSDLIKTDVQNDPNYLYSWEDFLNDTGDEGLKKTIKDRHTILSMELDDTYSCHIEPSTIAYQNITINELVASNDSISNVKDAAGEYDDWIELFNNTDQSIDLSESYLSDSKTDFQKWKFPIGTIIEPNGYLTIWADDDDDQPGIHANFKLNKAGDELRLSNTDGSVIDSITFAEQETNIAYARIPNGTGDFVKKGSTFGFNNEGTTSSGNIKNKILASVYPNPARESITIAIENFKNDYQVMIFDARGSIVHTDSTIHVESKIRIDHLTKGMYILQLKNESFETAHFKFIKL